jgi:hypothetical protein
MQTHPWDNSFLICPAFPQEFLILLGEKNRLPRWAACGLGLGLKGWGENQRAATAAVRAAMVA